MDDDNDNDLAVTQEFLARRFAFVLHNLFAVPFEEIAPIVGRTPAAARQLASRAPPSPGLGGCGGTGSVSAPRDRQCVHGRLARRRFRRIARTPRPGRDAACRHRRPDTGYRRRPGPSRVIVGAREIASQAFTFRQFAQFARPVLVNGLAGIATTMDGKPVSVMSVAVRHGKIVEIDILADRERLSCLDLTFLKD